MVSASAFQAEDDSSILFTCLMNFLSFLPFFNTYSMCTNEELTGFIIGSIITLLLAGFIILTSNQIYKRRIKNLRVGQYYRYYEDEYQVTDIVKILELDGNLLTYLTKNQDEVVTRAESFVECFEKLTDREIEKYSHLLPDK